MSDQAPGEDAKPTPPARPQRAHEVVEWIREHVILPGRPAQPLPTERQLEARTGAARKTVRKAPSILREEGWLKQLPRQGRVISRPRRRLLQTTGLFFPGRATSPLTAHFFMEIALGIRQKVNELHRQVFELCGFSRGPESIERSVFWSPNMRVIDSLLLLEVYDQRLIRQAGQLYPTVCLDVASDAPNVSSICFDHPASILMAYKYLLDLGHRRIGLVTRTQGADPAIRQRLDGFGEALRWIDAPHKREWLYGYQLDQDIEACLRPWRTAPADRRPTALVIVDAFWPCVAHLMAAGVRVPADLSVVAVGTGQRWEGWAAEADRQPFLAETAAISPGPAWSEQPLAILADAGLRLTTVDLPARAMGRWSMDEIDRRLRDPRAMPRSEILPPRLIEGTSTARLP